MGCCLTTAAADNLKIHSKTRDTSPPLPPGSGEETVKEVLSETPITSNKLPPTNSTTTKITGTTSFQSEEELRPKDVVVQIPIKENASEVSSENYTYSASFSAATTTTVGTGVEIDEDGEVTQKVKKPPPVKLVARRQGRSCSVEHAKRIERGGMPPSPARKPVVRSTDKNPRLTSRTVATTQRNRSVVSSNVVGRELSVRRSRSPAFRGEAGQLWKVKEQSPVKKSGKRVPVRVRENDVNGKLKKTNDVCVMPEPESERSESLDNPLVSLECFIFL